ncbi:FecR family protein [Paracoccus onubensis]|uniref:Iron dicitrate transport regulator FecR n=1 Tax=Paracoccus onubensis TaxID=1675788 RepID=A0A418SY47_9RHOB|nr:FecR domain-containing protein [Paracoccus onubensis]RJE85861.1 iron dicitrate transport regulator FecR [Paracoccus onubensis]
MSDKQAEEDRLFDEALELILRHRDDPSAPEQARRWRMISPAHEAAWAEAAAIHGMTGQALSDRHRPEASRHIGRRALLLGGLAAGGALTLPGLVTRARADFVTSTAEIRRVPLPDGSFATLGPDTALALRFADDRRGVRLLSGMAFFEIARDPAHDFTASSGSVIVTTRQSRFELGRDARMVSVAVADGEVDVQLDRVAGSPQATRITGGERLSFGPDGDPRMAERAPDQVAVWRTGLIVAENEPVSAVVARIARWQPGRVVLAAQSLADEQISGVFDLANPIMALEAVVHPYHGKVRQISPYLTVISRV